MFLGFGGITGHITSSAVVATTKNRSFRQPKPGTKSAKTVMNFKRAPKNTDTQYQKKRDDFP